MGPLNPVTIKSLTIQINRKYIKYPYLTYINSVFNILIIDKLVIEHIDSPIQNLLKPKVPDIIIIAEGSPDNTDPEEEKQKKP